MANTERVKEAVARAGLDAVLLMDDRDIYYATGFLPTDSAAIIARDAAWLVTDSRYIEAAQNQAAPGVEVVLTTRERPLPGILRELCDRNELERIGAEEEKLSHAMYLRMEKALGRELLPAQALLVELRSCKTKEELQSLIAAQRIAETALEEVLPLLKPGAVEREIAAELTYRMRIHGAEGNSFDPIVVTGAKSSMPHGVPGDEVIKSGDFVTMDFGCLKNGYCSDMTRTVAIGSATDEMRNGLLHGPRGPEGGHSRRAPGRHRRRDSQRRCQGNSRRGLRRLLRPRLRPRCGPRHPRAAHGLPRKPAPHARGRRHLRRAGHLSPRQIRRQDRGRHLSDRQWLRKYHKSPQGFAYSVNEGLAKIRYVV